LLGVCFDSGKSGFRWDGETGCRVDDWWRGVGEDVDRMLFLEVGEEAILRAVEAPGFTLTSLDILPCAIYRRRPTVHSGINVSPPSVSPGMPPHV